MCRRRGSLLWKMWKFSLLYNQYKHFYEDFWSFWKILWKIVPKSLWSITSQFARIIYLNSVSSWFFVLFLRPFYFCPQKWEIGSDFHGAVLIWKLNNNLKISNQSKGCEHGTCVKKCLFGECHNRCQCDAGWEGLRCNKDQNDCRRMPDGSR